MEFTFQREILPLTEWTLRITKTHLIFGKTAFQYANKIGAIICLPAKRHLNGISLVGQRWPEIVCWLGFGPIIASKCINHVT